MDLSCAKKSTLRPHFACSGNHGGQTRRPDSALHLTDSLIDTAWHPPSAADPSSESGPPKHRRYRVTCNTNHIIRENIEDGKVQLVGTLILSAATPLIYYISPIGSYCHRIASHVRAGCLCHWFRTEREIANFDKIKARHIRYMVYSRQLPSCISVRPSILFYLSCVQIASK
jgi:hypothetical protein